MHRFPKGFDPAPYPAVIMSQVIIWRSYRPNIDIISVFFRYMAPTTHYQRIQGICLLLLLTSETLPFLIFRLFRSLPTVLSFIRLLYSLLLSESRGLSLPHCLHFSSYLAMLSMILLIQSSSRISPFLNIYNNLFSTKILLSQLNVLVLLSMLKFHTHIGLVKIKKLYVVSLLTRHKMCQSLVNTT